jgi:hypothetical protein
VEDANKDQHPDLDQKAELTGPGSGRTTQPRGDHDTDEEREKRRHEVKGLLPLRRRGMYPKEHQVGRLGVSQDTVGDPRVRVEITAGERQQQGNQQGLLAAQWRIRDTHRGQA